jgi:hypothetical protein
MSIARKPVSISTITTPNPYTSLFTFKCPNQPAQHQLEHEIKVMKFFLKSVVIKETQNKLKYPTPMSEKLDFRRNNKYLLQDIPDQCNLSCLRFLYWHVNQSRDPKMTSQSLVASGYRTKIKREVGRK